LKSCLQIHLQKLHFFFPKTKGKNRKNFVTLFYIVRAYTEVFYDNFVLINIYYVTYGLRSSLLRQYLHCSQKRNVQRKMSCSFSTVNSVCGPTPYAPNELHIIPLESCRKDLTEYLTNLGVSGSRGFGTRITESDVILNRAGLHSLSKEDRERITVCPKHRYELTTHYQKLKSSCSHPSHSGEAKKLKNPRRVNKQVSEEIYQEFHVSVPIGSGKYSKPIFKAFPCNSPILGN